ncbi:ScyD/ScyE family protein [Nocardioides sp. SOB77]|uniref:ScyD/ScyE family protein n=1 Tax=Nocardioides oceani TaxID=3058369 RepID=A0ABT8FGV2_9ACTN|nr:ScyD/ScyE family protein [Nocardioides oceani]MDN4173670.1 ScyD/ScyE family protein [Nocardioides oceani]
MKRTTLAAASVAALALTLPTTGAATAAPAAPAPAADAQVVAKGLLSPLSLAVKSNGTAYVAQNFAGRLMKVRKGEKPVVVATAMEGREIGAVDVTGNVITYAVSWGENEGGIVRQVRNGRTRTIGDIGAAERATDPDAGNAYGFQGLEEGCEAPEFTEPRGGVTETHPYATAVAGDTVYVADAGANAVFAVTGGEVTPVAALPPVAVEVSEEAAAAQEWDPCVAGHTLNLEAVPTDIEVGRDGALYVSSLGPENPLLGAEGGVFKIDPATGTVTRHVSGFVGVTGLAVATNGDVYVTELFGGAITKVPAGGGDRVVVRRPAMPAAVELKGGSLWATTNAMTGLSGEPGDVPNGKVMRFGL